MRTRMTAAALFGLGATVLWSWGTVTAQSQQPASGGCDVAAELRLLRESIEATGKAQILSASAAMQQARIQPLMTELFATRKQLEQAQRGVVEASEELQNFRPSPGDAREATMQSQMANSLKLVQRSEATLRAREGDLATKLENEEAVWRQLMAQLQQVIKR